MCDPLIYILLGLAVGYIGGFAGIGGGPFLVSFLVLYCGMSQLVAQGSVLTMMLGPMSLLGVMSLNEYLKKQWLNITIVSLPTAFFHILVLYLLFTLAKPI